MGPFAKMTAILEERLALMAPARRLRLKVAEVVLSEFAGGEPIRVLDAGCGDGLISLALAKRHPSWQIVGVDLRSDLLEGARARGRGRGLDNVTFEVGNLLQPLPVHGFDAVIALECLSEIPDDEAALRVLSAALRPGGLLAADPAR
jgi:2-polyprenyl-3-methyl-5-hydroxy-6-metoxy-1,4-benzoquinol methylase